MARTVVFYSEMGLDRVTSAWRAFKLAASARSHSLDAEVVLAGPAVGLMRRDCRDRLDDKPRVAIGKEGDAGVSTPRCAEYRGVAGDELQDTGARSRDFDLMFVDLANDAQFIGRSREKPGRRHDAALSLTHTDVAGPTVPVHVITILEASACSR